MPNFLIFLLQKYDACPNRVEFCEKKLIGDDVKAPPFIFTATPSKGPMVARHEKMCSRQAGLAEDFFNETVAIQLFSLYV